MVVNYMLFLPGSVHAQMPRSFWPLTDGGRHHVVFVFALENVHQNSHTTLMVLGASPPEWKRNLIFFSHFLSCRCFWEGKNNATL